MTRRRRRLITTALAVCGVTAALRWSPLVLVVLAAGFGRPALRRRRRVAERGRALSAEIIQLVVLLELALAGGVSMRRALEDVVPWLTGDLHTALSAVLARVARGASLADELDGLAVGEFDRLQGLAKVIGATHRYGAPARAGLLSLLDDLRLEQRLRLEAEARQIPVRLLLPLVGGVLPAFVLLTVVPLLAGALAQLRLASP